MKSYISLPPLAGGLRGEAVENQSLPPSPPASGGKCIVIPSPNHDSRDGHVIDMLVLHYTGMKDGPRAIDRLIDPNAKVSAHYVVDEQGQVFHLVDEGQRAWHAGKAYWRGHTNINQRSIGIEIVNPGHEFGYRPFPKLQMQAVIALCKEILSRHNIPARNVVGHSDVAPTRKEDPGELFDWEWLAKEGIGLWPENITDGLEPKQEAAILLANYGYDTADLGKAITAFKRHFQPNHMNNQWDIVCKNIIRSLLNH